MSLTDYLPGISTIAGVMDLVYRSQQGAVRPITENTIAPGARPLSSDAEETVQQTYTWMPVSGSTFRSLLICFPVVGNAIVGAVDLVVRSQFGSFFNERGTLQTFDSEILKGRVKWMSDGKAALELGVRAGREDEAHLWFDRARELGESVDNCKEAEYERCLKQEPENAGTHWALARLYRSEVVQDENGTYPEWAIIQAKEHYKEAVRLLNSFGSSQQAEAARREWRELLGEEMAQRLPK